MCKKKWPRNLGMPYYRFQVWLQIERMNDASPGSWFTPEELPYWVRDRNVTLHMLRGTGHLEGKMFDDNIYRYRIKPEIPEEKMWYNRMPAGWREK